MFVVILLIDGSLNRRRIGSNIFHYSLKFSVWNTKERVPYFTHPVKSFESLIKNMIFTFELLLNEYLINEQEGPVIVTLDVRVICISVTTRGNKVLGVFEGPFA